MCDDTMQPADSPGVGSYLPLINAVPAKVFGRPKSSRANVPKAPIPYDPDAAAIAVEMFAVRRVAHPMRDRTSTS
jgi:hypothetical protein